MAITNEMIITSARFALMDEGIISGSGIIGYDPDGNKVELPEEIHTFQKWRSMGFTVKKGEHAIASFDIWKYPTGKRSVDEDGNETIEINPNAHCFMKKAHFFKRSQVEEM